MSGREAGRFNRRATVHRRATQTNTRGVARTDYAPVAALTRVAVAYREISLREIAMGNGVQPGIEAEAWLRDCTAARGVTVADRIEIGGVGFDIAGVGLPDPETGVIRLQIRRTRG